jgi:hypothetical protein
VYIDTKGAKAFSFRSLEISAAQIKAVSLVYGQFAEPLKEASKLFIMASANGQIDRL